MHCTTPSATPLPNRQGLDQTGWSGHIPPYTLSASRLGLRQHSGKRMPRPHDPNTPRHLLPSLFTKTHPYRLTRLADVAPVPTILHPTVQRGPVRAGAAVIHRFQVSAHLFTIIRCCHPPLRPPSPPQVVRPHHQEPPPVRQDVGRHHLLRLPVTPRPASCRAAILTTIPGAIISPHASHRTICAARRLRTPALPRGLLPSPPGAGPLLSHHMIRGGSPAPARG